MSWFLAATLATIIFGVYPVFGSKAGEIHGEKVNFIIDGCMMFLMCVIMSIVYRADFQKITKISFIYSLPLGLSSIGFILMLYAWRIAPTKLGAIQVTIGFSTIITAIICHVFTNAKLEFHQWVGAFIAMIGVSLVNLSKGNLSAISNLFKF